MSHLLKQKKLLRRRKIMLNETQIGELWLLFADYIDKKQLDSVAERYIELLLDNGVTDRTLQHAMGVEHNLDQAIEYYLEDEDDQEELDF